MNYEKYIKYTTEDFILDDDFMQWVLRPNQKNSRFWIKFIENHPENKQQVEDAVFIIKSIKAEEPVNLNQRLTEVYLNVKNSVKPKHKIGLIIKIAAVFLFLISVGDVWYYLKNDTKTFSVEFATAEQLGKGRIILPDGTVNVFETDETKIRQSASGELTINNDTLLLNEKSAKAKQAMAHVIIPYGKRSEIVLADGTKIWLNSGSQISYPMNFTGNTREVHLSGEAFFEVESNPAKPFYVITGDMKICVTGTKFNVTSYEGDQTTHAVLVSGTIDAARNKRFARAVELKPGEQIVYNKLSDTMEKEFVDVELYTSWINGYLIFDNEPGDNIFKKLKRFYNKDILTEKLSGHPTFTGKLDLADNLETVLKNIGFSASFSVDYENDVFLIRQKK